MPVDGGTALASEQAYVEAMQREFYYTLHGAVHGFAPPCLAATLFPAIRITTDDGKQHDLYGALYVMRKAEQDLNGVLDGQAARLREQHRGPSGVRQQLYTDALRKAGRAGRGRAGPR